MKQALLDRIRYLNKLIGNRLLIHLAGRSFGHFAILSHVGRRSGKIYRIPIIAEPFGNGFVIALTYGRKVDWYNNVIARGSCWLRWKSSDYLLVHPKFVDWEPGVMAFPPVFRPVLRGLGTRDFLSLEIQPAQDVQLDDKRKA